MPWILSKVSENIYAMPCDSVLSLFQLGKITRLPAPPEEIRGVIKFQGKIIQLLNINKMFNVRSSEEDIEEFNKMMEARRQDHINWLNQLEKSVLENTEFTLTTDPHKCAFGKWYDSYDPNNGNIMFMIAFSKFDKPHKEIHQIAIKAKEFLDKNDKKSAIDLIKDTKDKELKQMMHLFDELKASYASSKREIVIVLGKQNKILSFAVEEIVSIEEVVDISINRKVETADEKFLKGIAKRKTGEPVLLLNDDYIIDKFSKKEDNYSLS